MKNTDHKDFDDEPLIDSNNDSEPFEETTSKEAFDDGFEIFRLRNDPSPVLEKFKLRLMKCYKVEVQVKDKNGYTKTETRIKRIKNVTTNINKQGIEDIISYIEAIVNNHIVQSNIVSTEEHNKLMLFLSDDIVKHFIANRKDWNVSINYIDILITEVINLFDLLLRRTLFDKERDGYNKGHTTTVSKNIAPEKKENLLQKVGNNLLGFKG
jgi:hypothetical protein